MPHSRLATDDSDLYKKRDSRDFIIQKMFEDFEFAANSVKAFEKGKRSGVVDKWVVLSYMACYALYEGTFRKYHVELNLQNSADTYLKIARDVSKRIMDEGGFEIHNTGRPESDYYDLFNSLDLYANREAIFKKNTILASLS